MSVKTLEQQGRPAAPARQPREAVVVRFAGDSGDGIQLTGGRFAAVTALAGNDLATFPDFPAEIRAPVGTTYGVSAFQINFGARAIKTSGDAPDVLVALNPAALKVELGKLNRGGIVIVDSGAFGDRTLRKAGYTANPLEDGSLDALSHPRHRHFEDDAGGGEAVRPVPARRVALQKSVDARARLLDVRPRPAANERLGAPSLRR